MNLGLSEVEFEGVTLTVIKKMGGISSDRYEIGVFTRDGKDLRRCFHTCQFQHVRRSTNAVAHLLAVEGLRQGFQYWI